MERSLSKIRDIDLKILMELDDKDLFSFCLTSKYGKSLCNNEDFWRDRFVKKFGKSSKTVEPSWKDFYLKLVYYLGKYVRERFEYARALFEASKRGIKNIDLIKWFIKNGKIDLNWAMEGAALSGDKELVDFFISEGAYSYINSIGAAESAGHKELAKYILLKRKEWIEKEKF